MKSYFAAFNMVTR